MTLTDMRCDRCGRAVAGPCPPGSVLDDGGVRFGYHPGDPRMRDDSGVLCGRCWTQWTAGWGAPRARVCAGCDEPVTRRASLHLRRTDAVGAGWQLCAAHAVAALNELRTVIDKIDPARFRFPLDDDTSDDEAPDDERSE